MAAGADHHRDVAAQFRSLAAIEPSDSLRQYLQRIANGMMNWPQVLSTAILRSLGVS